MISLDHYLIDFIQGNTLTICALGVTLRGIAMVTPSVTDDKIVTMLFQFIQAIRDKNFWKSTVDKQAKEDSV